ncbi:hypothetical protein [Bradyrhizobium sp. NP1]|uniref:hypothetical protein n=1 Tax=Bradyrhizobium sp. NP1 TaxID=3049772 RepID=UPI0025A4E0F6|nr:hypothetical protein [Bradyrhizobium sp. NP1]WJR76018.1 hypothetical protein QOU61_25020 [Bradyrhizobium sp. NP1]
MAALNIPVRVDLEQLKQGLKDTTSLTQTATRQIAKQFLDINKELAKDALFGSMARGALTLASNVAIAVGSIKLISAAISGAREQMAQMVAIADKAQNLGVSPAFLQAFTAEAKKLKVEASELESALEHAFQATKEVSPIDINEWETGKEKITDVEKALRVYNETLAKAAGQRLEGLVLFRVAKTQEEKIQAVLKAMIQLQSIGQQAASFDLGERMFGSQIVDRMRQGRTSAESMLETIKSASANADGIFSDVLVNRAKELDEQLKLAHQRLSTALKPSWDDLASVLLTIKGYWADTVDLIAKAVEWSNKIKIPGFTSSTDLEAKRDALATVNNKLNGGWGMYGMFASRETLEGQRDRLQSEIAALAQGEQYGPAAPGQSRGTGPAPTKKPTGTETDRLETSADTIAKRAAALQAEAAAIDEGTAARERSKIVAQLETVAKQANAAAGKGENVVTEDQRKRIDEVADAYSKAAESIQKARIASDIKFGQKTALLDPADVAIAQQLREIYPNVADALNSVEAQAIRTNDAMRSISSTASSTLTSGLANILDGTRSVSQGFADMSRAIVRALEEAMIKMLIVQPLMRSLGGALGFSDGGIVGSGSAPSTVMVGNYAMPKFATGGVVSGPGGPRDDRIPALLSDGEYVVNAGATAKHRALLEAINRGVPRFADGGSVGDGTLSAPLFAGQQTTIAPTFHVNVQGSPGMTKQDHQRMGETIAKTANAQIQSMIAAEIRMQTRPGGILKR